MTHKIFNTSDYAALRETLRDMNPVDIAEEFEAFDETPEAAVKYFRMLPKDTAADVFAYLPNDIQQGIISAIKDYEIKNIIDELFIDDAVDFIEEMPAGVVKRVLSNLPAEKRDIINHFLKYPEGSAGSIMTIEYIDLKMDLTVGDAFARIRREGADVETFYTCYVTDAERRIVGAASVRALLLASPDDKIGDVMERGVIYAATGDDKESLANDFRKYGLLAMPVVDNENRLVGIVTVDDVMEVQEDEATEDFEIMAAVSPLDEPYLKTSVWQLTRSRVLWLLLLMLSATVTGSIIGGFEEALATVPALVAFIPMLMDTGGNAGSQSSTLIIRGMALEEIELRDVLRVFWKELRVALLCGAALSIVNFLRIVVMGGGVPMALTVTGTLFLTIMLSKSVGCLLPLGAKKLRLDPAVMASPVITTIVDAGALLLYFGIAKAILKL
ncbi:MAG: magnesium transporter [Oscillospiraceae bacterium]|jgi:magnesium transporter|nr:magnesium transporter [Oscillospiraceae bacterium]